MGFSLTRPNLKHLDKKSFLENMPSHALTETVLIDTYQRQG